MFSLFLTQSGGFLGTIAKPFGWILNAIYEFLTLFEIHNIALCIILFTFITKALMIPLTIKQQKFSKMSSVMQPELAKLNAKYKGKKDEASVRKMQAEQAAIYEKYGVSPTAGCLPLLIQLPIMLALYRVIQNIPAYVPDVKAYYEPIADQIRVTGTEYVATMKDIASSVGVSTSKFSELANNEMSVNHIIDILAKFNTGHWGVLIEKFPNLSDVITSNSAQIMKINSFVGNLNIADTPNFTSISVLIPVLSVLTSWLQTKLSLTNSNQDKDAPGAGMMNSMNTIMPLMSGMFCLMLPIGIGLYWVAGGVFTIVQQLFINKYMNSMDVNQLIDKSREKALKKKAKRGGDAGVSMEQVAKKQTRSIDVSEPKVKSTKDFASVNSKKGNEPSDFKKSEVSYKAGSIAANANLMKSRNNDKGDK